ncbi:MAG: MoaD/ThiS family protein [Pelagibacteraceae bacterium]|nr:MoaD/ThiS family protein [Pelagibacteraceae bacterium]
MKIKVELFGVCKELSDKDYINLELDENSKIKDLRNEMIKIVKNKFPENSNYLEMVKKSAFSSKDEIVEDAYKLHRNDTISIIPPIGGG